MKNLKIFILLLLSITASFAQTKVSGYVYDDINEPVAFANIIFKGTTEGTITDENGKFYLESDETHPTLLISFIG